MYIFSFPILLRSSVIILRNVVYRVHKYQEVAMSESPLIKSWPENQEHLHFLGSLSQMQNQKPTSTQLESVG